MRRWFLVVPLMFLLSQALLAQEDMFKITHHSERGFSFAMGFSGTGVGAFYRKMLPHYSHLGLSAEFFIMRDEKEFQGVDIFGNPVTINKVNRLFFVPLNGEYKKRLFVDDIEDNFRPNLVLQAGPIFGMNFPRVEDLDNEYQFGVNVLVGAGVDVRNGKDYFVSVRPQFRLIYFPDPIAGKKNHSSLEIKLELGSWTGRK